jgi:hypothetical protein
MAEETTVIELDHYECGVVFNSLNDERNQLIAKGRPTDAVDEVILKVANATGKRKRGRDEAR